MIQRHKLDFLNYHAPMIGSLSCDYIPRLSFVVSSHQSSFSRAISQRSVLRFARGVALTQIAGLRGSVCEIPQIAKFNPERWHGESARTGVAKGTPWAEGTKNMTAIGKATEES
jgi:hypothetical protein